MDCSKDVSDGGGDGEFFPKGRAPAPVLVAAPDKPDALQTGEQTDANWRLEPHVCRVCLTRLVSRPGTGSSRVYHCPNCGAEGAGKCADVLCACGMKIRRPMRDGRSGVQLVDAGVRCMPNPDPRPDFPSLFVASDASG